MEHKYNIVKNIMSTNAKNLLSREVSFAFSQKLDRGKFFFKAQQPEFEVLEE
tara:strand:+ start:137 stop:292 length:156 start_codon:yes stop_codon:yes gene_type:complete